MKIIVLLLLVLGLTMPCIGQWKKLLDVQDSSIRDINFLTTDDFPTYGIISTVRLDGAFYSTSIYRTTDGGETWQRQISPNIFNLSYVNSSAIKDKNTLWVGTGSGTFGELYRSDDFGLNFYSQPLVEDPSGMFYLHNKDVLMLSGMFGFYTSTDLGNSWSMIASTPTNDIYLGFAFLNDSVGMVSSGVAYSSPLPDLFTTDGGKTWGSPMLLETGNQPLAVKNTSTYFLASERTYNILRSDDFGKKWDTVYMFDPLQVTGCIVGDLCNLFVQTADQGVFQSTNQGKSWQKVADLRTGAGYRFFYHNNVLFISDESRDNNGWNSTLWRYTLPPNKPTMIVDDVVITTPPCSSTDTIGIFLPIAAVNQCDGDKVVLDTMFVTGSTDFIITYDSLDKEIVWDTIRVRYQPSDISEDTAFVHFRFKLKGHYFDTVMTIRGKGTQPQDSVSFLASITKPSVTWEETTALRVVPNKVVANKGLAEIRFDVTLDADVLEPLTNYSTGITGASIVMLAATPVGKLTRFPFVITGNNMTLDPAVSILNLPMRPYVSDTTMTTINVFTIQLNPQDPDYERCTLSATGNDVPFQLDLMCGDSILSQYLGGKPILTINSLKPNPANEDVTIDFNSSITGQGTLQIISDAGNVSFEENIQVVQNENSHEVKLSFLSSGTFFIRLQIGNNVVTGKFVKQ